MHFQFAAVSSVGAIGTMLRINCFDPVGFRKRHMMTLVSGLTACFFTALFTLAFWADLSKPFEDGGLLLLWLSLCSCSSSSAILALA